MPDERSPLLKRSDTVPIDEPDGSSTVSEPIDAPVENIRLRLLSVVMAMSLGVFLAAMDQTIVVASYASIGSELKQLQKTSWIATAYMLTLASFQPLYGRLSDIFGRKSCLIGAYSIFAVGSLLCGLANTMDQLIIARAIAGVGGGGMSTVGSIILTDLVPLRDRAVWQGIINIVYASGSATGAPLGGFLSDGIGWRWAFLIQVPMAISAILLVALTLHLPHISNDNFAEKIKRVDFAGAFSLIVAILSLLYGLERGGDVSWKDPLTLVSLASFCVFAAVFVAVEWKFAAEPFAPKRIIANRSLIASYLVNFFGIGSSLSMTFYLPLYLQAVQNLTASQAGLWLLPHVLGATTGSLGGGFIIRATGKFYAITILSNCLHFIGLNLMTLFTGVVAFSAALVLIGNGISGIGNGSNITTSLISLIANAGMEDQAIATAVSYLFRSVGSVVGVSVASTITQSVLRSSLQRNLPPDQDIDHLVRRIRESLDFLRQLEPETRLIVQQSYEHAIHYTMWYSVGLGACGVISSLFIKEKVLLRK